MNDLVHWWRGVSSTARPERPLLVVAIADDPDAVSALAPDFGSQWQHRTTQGSTATARVAEHLQVPIHVLGETPLPEGHDLILLADSGRGLTSRAAEVAVARFDAEPQLVVGMGSGISDSQWMEKVVRVRARAGTEELPEPVAALAGVLEVASERDVPVLLDGAVSAAAAAVASTCPQMQIPVMGDEPVQKYFVDRIEAGVWGGNAVGPGLGLGALSGLAMLRLALLAADV